MAAFDDQCWRRKSPRATSGEGKAVPSSTLSLGMGDRALGAACLGIGMPLSWIGQPGLHSSSQRRHVRSPRGTATPAAMALSGRWFRSPAELHPPASAPTPKRMTYTFIPMTQDHTRSSWNGVGPAARKFSTTTGRPQPATRYSGFQSMTTMSIRQRVATRLRVTWHSGLNTEPPFNNHRRG